MRLLDSSQAWWRRRSRWGKGGFIAGLVILMLVVLGRPTRLAVILMLVVLGRSTRLAIGRRHRRDVACANRAGPTYYVSRIGPAKQEGGSSVAVA